MGVADNDTVDVTDCDAPVEKDAVGVTVIEGVGESELRKPLIKTLSSLIPLP